MEKAADFNIYLQFEQCISVTSRTVRLSEAADICSSNAEASSVLKKMVIATLNKNESRRVVSAMDVIKQINKKFPGANISVLGENDFIISCKEQQKKDTASEYVRTALVCLIMFFGAAFSIATFNNDVDVSLLFDQLLSGFASPQKLRVWLNVSYSAGIPLGILIFYNHLSKKEMYNDPTPLEIEMRMYEQESNTAAILNESRKEENSADK